MFNSSSPFQHVLTWFVVKFSSPFGIVMPVSRNISPFGKRKDARLLQPLRETLLWETTEFSFVHRPNPLSVVTVSSGMKYFSWWKTNSFFVIHLPSFSSHRGQGRAFLINHRSFDSLYRVHVQNPTFVAYQGNHAQEFFFFGNEQRSPRFLSPELFPLKMDFKKWEKEKEKGTRKNSSLIDL